MLVEGSSWRPEPDPDPGPGRSWSLPRVPWRPFYYAEWRVVDFLAAVLASRNSVSGMRRMARI